ncbi:MAG: hypothetical protein KA807_18320 [Prolixibacteraceae bacterium]|nr:hypothetical protein [Prolixibacteraceae bacterium]
MKTKIQVVLLIIFLLQLNSCQTTKYGFNKSDLKANYKIVEKIINNVDSLYSIFSDPSLVDKNIFLNKKNIEISNAILTEHILENKFLNGYDFVDEDITEFYSDDPKIVKHFYYEHKIKIKSRYNGEIIWFVFINETGTVWKFASFYFCNNYNERSPHNPVPCDKK